jgi:hypothetical protein
MHVVNPTANVAQQLCECAMPMVDYRTYVRGKLAMYCPWAMWQ